MRHLAVLALAAATSLALGCGGGLLISPKQERELGAGVHDQLAREYRLLTKNDPISQWAVELVRPLERASKPFRDPAEIGGYKVAVIHDDKLINAFAAPGGYTYLSTGLILSATTCAEITGVMGHELAHVTQKHGVKAMERQVAAATLAEWFLGDGVSKDAVITAFAVVQNTRFSREQESESDEVGLQIAHDAGSNPYGLVSFFEKLLKQGGGGGPEFLSSHPATDRRVADTSSQIRRRYPQLRKDDARRNACQGTRLTLGQVQERIRKGQLAVQPGTGK